MFKETLRGKTVEDEGYEGSIFSIPSLQKWKLKK